MKELLLIFFIFDETDNGIKTAVLLIIIGWVLGAFSSLIIPLIIDSVKKHNSKKETKKGIGTELKELQLRLTGICWQTTILYDKLSKEWVKWIKPYYEKYEKSDEYFYPVRKSQKTYLPKLNDDEFYELMIKTQEDMKKESLKTIFKYTKIVLLYLESNYNNLSFFKENHQMEIIRLRREIISINEEFGEINLIQAKTYSEIPENIRKHVKDSLIVSYIRISSISERILKLIENILQY